jgi:hypothetical protein
MCACKIDVYGRTIVKESHNLKSLFNYSDFVVLSLKIAFRVRRRFFWSPGIRKDSPLSLNLE